MEREERETEEEGKGKDTETERDRARQRYSGGNLEKRGASHYPPKPRRRFLGTGWGRRKLVGLGRAVEAQVPLA